MKIVEFGDSFTKNIFQTETQKTFAMIKPDAIENAGKIISRIEGADFVITKLKMLQMTHSEAEEFYAEHKGKPFYENLVNFISSGKTLGMELMGTDAVFKWRELIGPTNCQVARMEKPQSIRALYGIEGVRNAVHGSDSEQSSKREIDFYFNKVNFSLDFLLNLSSKENINCQVNMNPNNIYGNSLNNDLKQMSIYSSNNQLSCIVIKPHILKEFKSGEIITMVSNRCKNENIVIAGIEMFNLNKEEVEEFLHVYKDVVSEFSLISEELANGRCIAIALKGESMVVKAIRKICGPHDPQIAKTLRQNTLRAIYGRDKVCNSVHCTDLDEDGQRQCEYFFSILQR